MAEKTWLDYVTALGAVATPMLVLLLTAVGWRFRLRLERRFALEDNLREDRVEAYNAILEPFVILLTSDAAWNTDPKNRGRDKSSAGAQKIHHRLDLLGTRPTRRTDFEEAIGQPASSRPSPQMVRELDHGYLIG